MIEPSRSSLRIEGDLVGPITGIVMECLLKEKGKVIVNIYSALHNTCLQISVEKISLIKRFCRQRCFFKIKHMFEGWNRKRNRQENQREQTEKNKQRIHVVKRNRNVWFSNPHRLFLFKKRSILPYGHQFSWPASIPHLHIFQFHFWSCDNRQGFFHRGCWANKLYFLRTWRVQIAS